MPAWRRLAEQFQDLLVYLLLAAVAVSLAAWLLEGGEDVPFEVVVISMILVATAPRLRAEACRAGRGRCSAWPRSPPGWSVTGARRVVTTDIVPGDVLVLAEGDAAADARLAEAASLTVAEASLTGESEPVLKDSATLTGPVAGDRLDMVFSGTAVARGVDVRWSPPPAWTPRWATWPACSAAPRKSAHHCNARSSGSGARSPSPSWSLPPWWSPPSW